MVRISYFRSGTGVDTEAKLARTCVSVRLAVFVRDHVVVVSSRMNGAKCTQERNHSWTKGSQF
jgi:NMD protein affecting ribosome stability and mRNA decay